MGHMMSLSAFAMCLLAVTLMCVGIAGNAAWPFMDVMQGDHFSPAVASGLIALLAGIYLYLSNQRYSTEIGATIALLLNAVSLAFNCHMIVHSANKVKYTSLMGGATLAVTPLSDVTMSTTDAQTATDNHEAMVIVMLVFSTLIFLLNLCAIVYISVGLYGDPFGFTVADSRPSPPAYVDNDDYRIRRAAATLPKRARSDMDHYPRYAGYKPRY